MNRRNFFKVVTGFVAGVFAMCAPKGKSKLRDYDAHLVLGDDFDERDLMRKVSQDIYGDPDMLVMRDDTAMIQEAIDLAKDGGVVYFPKGTYNLKYGIMV